MYSNCQIYVPDRKPPMGARRNPYLLINRGIVLDTMMWEGGGPTVEDLSGNGNDGTEQQDSVWQPGSYGSTRYFSGDDRINLAKNACPPSLPFTTIVRFKIDDNTVFQRLVDADGSTIFDGLWMNINNAGKCAIEFGDGTGDSASERRTGVGNTILSTDTWYTAIGVVRGATDMSIFINGIDEGNLSYSGSGGAYVQGTVPGFIGALYLDGTFNYLSGSISYVLIYNRALSSSEITLLYREPFCGFRWTSIIELASYVAAVGGDIAVLRRRIEAA